MMRPLMMTIMLLFPAAAIGAEAVVLRHTGSIYSDVAGTGILEPEGVGCGKLAVIVADTGHGRLHHYALSEGSVKAGAEIRGQQIVYPQRVRLGSKGDIFVLDGKQHRILRLTAAGEFIGFVEPKGPADFAGSWIPKSFAIDANDNLAVLETSGSRVVVLGAEGAVRKQIALPPGSGFFSDVAVDPQGAILVLDSVAASLYSVASGAAVFTPLAKGLKEYASFPTSLAVDRRNIYVVDQNGGRIALLGRDGSFQGHKLRMGWKEGELRYPSDICLDDAGNLFIADRGNNRVQLFIRESER